VVLSQAQLSKAIAGFDQKQVESFIQSRCLGINVNKAEMYLDVKKIDVVRLSKRNSDEDTTWWDHPYDYFKLFVDSISKSKYTDWCIAAGKEFKDRFGKDLVVSLAPKEKISGKVTSPEEDEYGPGGMYGDPAKLKKTTYPNSDRSLVD
jgi:hypothetical protein